ncbi:MAG: glycosyltransferase family 2 protein [Candidatus Latescibacterota bacterium]|jgi:glycosyltransferase involved in cell wall biosynthesis|nr:MAG: glycosyltransferase family 2 protein [Candidatus Latescibacterota bacterium]
MSQAPGGVTVVIPAYNEEKGLGVALPALTAAARERGWEVIVIDDGSTDGTASVAESHGARVIRHPDNKGYGAALKTGIRNASNDLVVMMDSDGQHDSSRIEELLSHMDRYDMVVGARWRMTGIRAPGKKILSIVANFLAGVKIPDLNSGLRAFRRDTIKSFLHFCPNSFSFTTTITLAYLREGYSIKYVPIEVERRVGRASTVKFFRDGYKTFLLIVRVIVLFNPLKVFMPVSLALFALGTVFTIYGIAVYGRAPNVGVLTILSSIILFFMGVLADQISALRRERRYD